MSTEKLNFRSTIKLTKNNLISLFGLKKKALRFDPRKICKGMNKCLQFILQRQKPLKL